MALDPTSHRSTERVLCIFEYLTETENVGKNLTDIAAELDAPKSSILPMLKTLVSHGYLYYNPLTYQYFIGHKLYVIGTKYSNDTPSITDAVTEIMKDVANAHNATVIFGELVSGDVLYLQKVDLFEKLRLYKAVGRRLPAYSLALGKVLLSEMSPTEIVKLYPAGLTAITKNTITDFDVLLDQLETVRATGFSRCYEEATQFVCSVAVPIRKNGIIAYGLQASTSILEYTEERERQLIFALYEAKSKIEAYLKAHD